MEMHITWDTIQTLRISKLEVELAFTLYMNCQFSEILDKMEYFQC